MDEITAGANRILDEALERITASTDQLFNRVQDKLVDDEGNLREDQTDDTICACTHWFEEHADDGECMAPNCTCTEFSYSATLSTPEAIADRGGDPECWPQRTKDALGYPWEHDG
jgi:hypothetical protein